MNWPMSMPIMAMMGRMAFGSAWRRMMRRPDRPLARAVRMKSWFSTSIMAERTMRAYQPAPRRPSVAAGSTMLEKLP